MIDISFISLLSFDNVFECILQAVSKKKKLLLFALNVHSLRLICEQPNVRRAFLTADIIFPDGVPILWMLKRNKYLHCGRVSGTDLVEKLLLHKGTRIFLLGSIEDTVLRIISKYGLVENGGTIAGHYCPALNSEIPKFENKRIRFAIRKSKAKIVLVALGQPKQELWIFQNCLNLPVFVTIGVGSALEILSGTIIRAPVLLRNNGFEWAWRLIKDPWRLLPRYFKDSVFLVQYIFKP
jgi:N-acetylglucosaminyldiphosphoundecaprenol N-acetyl-beta-D-mannosaminyltransferase